MHIQADKTVQESAARSSDGHSSGAAVANTAAPCGVPDDGADECAETITQVQPRPAQPTETRSALRVHVEQHTEGLVVWLGWDGPASTAPVVDVVSALYGRAPATRAIAAVVCNGRTLYARRFTCKENT